MQLNPRYGPNPIIRLDTDPADIARAAVRQRQRLIDTLSSFSAEQWAHPSRCDGWSNQDVIAHLDSTNAFWGASISAGLKGTPSQYLAAFDPDQTPKDLIEGYAEVSASDVLEGFATSSLMLAERIESLDGDDWFHQAEAPVGHMSVLGVVHHALWDSWVHERDIMEPLGLAQAEESDEVLAALRYASSLRPAVALGNGDATAATLGVRLTDLAASFSVSVGDDVVVSAGIDDDTTDLVVDGRGVELIDVFSRRRPIGHVVPAELGWMFRAQGEPDDD